MGILGFLGFLIIALLVFVILVTVAAIVGAFFVWRTIVPNAQHLRLHIDNNGIRAFTEQGEIIPGTVMHKRKNDAEAAIEKPKRYLTVGDDGELVDVDEIYTEGDDTFFTDDR